MHRSIMRRWSRFGATAAALLLSFLAGLLPAVEYKNKTFTADGAITVASPVSDPNLILTGCTVDGTFGTYTFVADGGTLTVNPSSLLTGSVVLRANSVGTPPVVTDPGTPSTGTGEAATLALPPVALLTYAGSDLWLETDENLLDLGQVGLTTTSDARFSRYFTRKGMPIAVLPLYDTVTGAHYAWAVKGWNPIDDAQWKTLVGMHKTYTGVAQPTMAQGTPLWWVLRVGSGSWAGATMNLTQYPSQGCPSIGEAGILGMTIRVVRKGKGTVVLADQLDYATFRTCFPAASYVGIISGYSGTSSYHYTTYSWNRSLVMEQTFAQRAAVLGLSSDPALNLPFGSDSVFENGVLRMADTVELHQAQATDCDTGESYSVMAKRTGY